MKKFTESILFVPPDPAKALSSDEAYALLREDPSRIGISVPGIAEALGVSMDFLRRELERGTLRAYGRPTPHPGRIEITVRGDDLLQWMLLPHVRKRRRK